MTERLIPVYAGSTLADMVEHRDNKEIYFTFSRLALDNHTRICFPKNFQAQFLRIAQPVPG